MTKPEPKSRPTVRDVAALAGVSIATVSTTFARPEKVRPITQRAVRQAAEDLGYVPNASAQGLVNGRSNMIGLMSFGYVVPDETDAAGQSLADSPAEVPIITAEQERVHRLGSGYVEKLHRGMQLECGRRKLSLVLGGTEADEPGPIVPPLLSLVDGLAVLPWAIPPGLKQYRRRGQPVVTISYRESELSDDSVTLDNVMGMRAIVAHLARVHGRQRFLFVTSPAPVGTDHQARLEGFELGVKENRLTRLPPLELPDAEVTDRLRAHLAEYGPVDAVVCAHDRIAESVLASAPLVGLKVPTEVSVTGVDGDLRGALLRPALTSMRGSVEQMGRTAVGLICDRLANPDLPRRDVVLAVSLVVRSSCGC